MARTPLNDNIGEFLASGFNSAFKEMGKPDLEAEYNSRDRMMEFYAHGYPTGLKAETVEGSGIGFARIIQAY